jgi:hypothetical protein
LLELEIAGSSLRLENIPSPIPTYRGAQGSETNIDLTMTNMLSKGVSRWKITEFADSDHNLISFNYATNPTKRQVRVWSRMPWARTRAEIDARHESFSRQTSPAEMTRIANNLANNIVEQVNKYCPLRDAKRRNNNEVWRDPEISKHVAHKRKLLQKMETFQIKCGQGRI